jgi:hypothetical protein
MKSTKILTASCSCKSVQFTVTVPTSSLPLPVHLCHCSICRYTHGALCTFHAPLPDGVQPDFIAPSEYSKLTTYKHSNTSPVKHFCSACGCQVGDIAPDGIWVISSAIFDANKAEPGIWELKTHIFTTSAPGGLFEWVPNVGGREMEVWNPDSAEETATQESGVSRTAATEVRTEGDSERLLAQCHCGGVSFSIPRPSAYDPDDPEEWKKWVSPLEPNKWIASADFCDDCRLVTGTNPICWTFVPVALIRPLMPSDLAIGSSKVYHSSDGVRRTFCGTCGATVFYHEQQERPHIIDVAVGLLRSPDGVRAEDWLTWRAGRLGWPDSGQRYDADFTNAFTKGLSEWGRAKYGVNFTSPIG